MSSHPNVITKRTIKQAKADFKARGRPTISVLEQKQLERSIQLDRRAWGVKEREKRKAEAAKARRVEKERSEKDAREKKALAGGKTRSDRFGYASSQMHLGAFFGGGGVKNEDVKSETKVEVKAENEDDMFGDDGLDDETLLETLKSPVGTFDIPQLGVEAKGTAELPATTRSAPQQCHAQLSVTSRTIDSGTLTGVARSPFGAKAVARTSSTASRAQTEPPAAVACDPSDFWDDLESSTQIARDLAFDEPKVEAAPPTVQHQSRTATQRKPITKTSANNKTLPGHFFPSRLSGTASKLPEPAPPPQPPMRALSFAEITGAPVHLTAPPSKPAIDAERDRKLRPPPMMKRHVTMRPPPQPVRQSRPAISMPPPPITTTTRTPHSMARPISKPSTKPVVLFTMTELENFVDDDLQLTQVAPG
ncbi:hypothetical protein LTR56_008564 [Elasticomyces elasticus]|nr:hypothetical protein LTR56_008564 [Elasticomyces elasticus]KAK3653305.1 hypothetical protein LTR22_011265 [Elasticomyces elasticus]KAK4918249.1 hypothetical protein LTR49_013948 [Elasticomyces elasticus]